MSAPALHGRRRRAWFTVGIAAGAVLPVAVLVAFSLIPGDGNGSAPDVDAAEIARQQHALQAFDTALDPVIEDAGATVVYGMRPGINDIYDGRFDDATLQGMAEGWVGAMQRARDDFAAIDVPAFLSDVAALYLQAFDAYVETAEALHEAASATGDEREERITEAADAGSRADDLYDAAQNEHQQHRDRLGVR